MHKLSLRSDDRLQILQSNDPSRPWQSLDDQRQCVLCERTFTGRQVRITSDRRGRHTLHCPNEECPATPHEWVAAGNPLIDDAPWRDWVRILNELSEEPEPQAHDAA